MPAGLRCGVIAFAFLASCTHPAPSPGVAPPAHEAGASLAVSEALGPGLPCVYSRASSGAGIPMSEEYSSLTDMPEPIYARVAEFVGFKGRPDQLKAKLPDLIAPRGGRWQATDVIMDEALPNWHFLGGVRSKHYWHVWMETGGIGRMDHVLIIQPEHTVQEVHVKAHFTAGTREDLCELVQILEKVELVGGTASDNELWY